MMASDLTPKETLHANAFLSPSGETVLLVPLDVALAAVAAERERCGERLLSDEARKAASVEWLRVRGGGGPLGTNPMQSALSAAWRVVTGSNHE